MTTIHRTLALLVVVVALSDVAPAHVPHDVVTAVAVSPAYATDRTIFAVVRDSLLRSNDGGVSWRRLTDGLARHVPVALAVSPRFADDRTVFVATRRAGLFVSRDRGRRWHRTKLDRDVDVVALAFAHADDPPILALDANGRLHRGSLDGATWTRVGPDGERFSAFATDPHAVTAVTADGALFRSDAGATSWAPWHAVPDVRQASALCALPEGGVVIAAENGAITVRDRLGEPTVERALERHRLVGLAFVGDAGSGTVVASGRDDAAWFSDDLGQTWTSQSAGLERDAQADAYGEAHFGPLRATASGELLLGSFTGLYRSADRGRSWTHIETLPPGLIVSLAVSDAVDGRHQLALGTYGAGAYVFEPDAERWRVCSRGLPNTRLGPVAFAPGREPDSTIFTATFSSLLTSTSGGRAWTVAPLQHEVTQRGSAFVFPVWFGVSPGYRDDGVLFAAMRPAGLLRVARGSAPESVSPSRMQITSLALSPAYPADQTLFAAAMDGLHRSTDGGDTWVEVGDPRKLRSQVIALSPGFAEDRTLFAGGPAGLQRSRDGGDSWTSLTIGPARFRHVVGLAVSPSFPDDREIAVQIAGGDLLIGRDSVDGFSSERSAARRGGLELSQLRGFVRDIVPLVAYSPVYASDRTLYGSNGFDLLRSTDRGATWRRMRRPRRYESDARAIDRSGTWHSQAAPLYSGSHSLSARRPGSRVTLRFHGDEVRWIGSRGPEHGVARVSVDGGEPTSVDLHHTTNEYGVECFVARGLESGEHSITIEVGPPPVDRGALVTVDAVDVWR